MLLFFSTVKASYFLLRVSRVSPSWLAHWPGGAPNSLIWASNCRAKPVLPHLTGKNFPLKKKKTVFFYFLLKETCQFCICSGVVKFFTNYFFTLNSSKIFTKERKFLFLSLFHFLWLIFSVFSLFFYHAAVSTYN